MKLILCAMRTLGLYFLILISACTTVTKPDGVDDPELEWQTRQSELNQISSWKINGRLAVTNKAEVWHISVKWKQEDHNYKIHLSGPFGAGAVLLTGDQTGVIIKANDESTFATNPEQVLYETTGIKIPLQNLTYWTRGIPSPETEITNQIIDPYGRLKRMSQNNWDVRIKRYKKVRNIYLPSKVFIKKDSLDIRFIIEDWIL